MLDEETIARIITVKDRVIDEFDAGDWQSLALCLEDSGAIITNHSRLLRSLNWQDPDYAACVGDVLGKLIKQEPKALDLIESMLEKNDIRQTAGSLEHMNCSREMSDRSGIDTTIVAAMMPFHPSFDDVRAAMRAACESEGLELKAADDIWQHSILIEDIFDLIEKACIVIVDFTGKNPNVMYETGIAHALNKEVIPITQSLDDVPFDVRHHRILKYTDNERGRAILKSELENRIGTIMEQHGWRKIVF